MREGRRKGRDRGGRVDRGREENEGAQRMYRRKREGKS